MPPAESDHFNSRDAQMEAPIEAQRDASMDAQMLEAPRPDPIAAQDERGLDERAFDTPALSLPSENENSGISTLPLEADADLLPVVGLGGSAGSIAPLQNFFDAMPPASGLAFVVVLHLSPDFESQLCEVLQAHTAMPVVSVDKRVRVEANHIYVIPPGQHLEMQNGHIGLTPMENEFGKRVAVDLFFRSLAASQRSRAVAVVLSGLDSDGSVGIKRVKEHGGVTIAQDPDEAQHDGMPRSAIQTGMVDWILPISELAPRLLEFWANEKRIQLPPGEAPAFSAALELKNSSERGLNDADEVALREILAFLLARTGHDFAHYKRATTLRRIGRRLQVNSLTNLPAYVAFLRTHNGEAGALLQDLLISVTNFFRDPEAFCALEAHIPALFRGKKASDQVRVWVAGCATGEEAYSVAMLLAEHAATLVSPPSIQVFATDIDEEATRTAREGRFPQAIAADVSPDRLRRFFLLDHGHYRVRTELREIVLFASHNLLRDSPFSHLDMVTCRNLLIYFQPQAQEQVFGLFHFALNADGILFLGGSEARDESEGLFAVLDKKQRIYGRRAGSRRPLQLSVPTPRAIALPAPNGLSRGVVAQSANFSPRGRGRGVPDFGGLHLRLLEQWSPPSVLVTQNFDILHLSERAGRFMQFRGGAVSTNLLSVVHPDLRLELRSALMNATQGGQSVDVPGLPLELDGLPRIVDLRVRPLRDDDNPGGAVNYLMVVFDDREVRPTDAVFERTQDDIAVRRLEREASHLKEHLRSVIEQYEATTEELKASNEELQAMNEELRSAGEELETSKEELQAANEELLTVNQELKSKVEELARSNGDLQNLMAATSIATIFLDRELCIQRFTPPAVELFNLIPTDTFRPLSDLRHSLQYPAMIDDARLVIEKLQPIEREVSGEDGRWFLARALPYRSLEDRIDGVVFTFVDISRRFEAELELRRSETRYRSLFTSIEEAFALCEIIVDAAGKAVDYRLLEVNAAFERATGISSADANTKTARELIPSLEDRWVEMFGRVALTGEVKRVEEYSTEFDRWFETFVSPIGERGNGRFALVFNDITPRKTQEEELRRLSGQIEQQSRVFDTTLTAINDFAYLFDRAGRFTYSNRPLLDLLGVSLEEIIGKNFFDLGYPPDLAGRLQGQIETVFTQKITVRADTPFVAPGGEPKFYEYIFNPILGANGEVESVAGSTRDITARKRREAHLAFLSEFSESLISLAAESQIAQLFGEEFGALTGAGVCAFFRIDAAQNQAETTAEWHRDDAFQLQGQFDIAQLVSPEFERLMRQGETVVVREVASDARIKSPESLATFGIGSFVNVPFIRGGEWQFVLGVYHDAPYPWREEEVELLGEASQRIWTKLERARADEALRESEEGLRLAIEAAEMGTWQWDLVRDKTYWNERHFLLLGLTPRAEPLASADFFRYLHPDDRAAVLQKIEAAIAENGIYQAEFRAILQSGEVRWMSGYGRVVDVNSVGRATRMSGVMIDIDDRIRAAERMRESEARFRVLVDSVQDYAIITLTPDNRIETWNPAAAKIFGYELAEVAGQFGDMLFTPEGREAGEPQQELETARREGRAADERWHQRKDGSRFYASGVMTALQDDSRQGFVKILRDLTAQKQAEEALRASEARFRTQADAIPQIIWTNNSGGAADHFNKRWFDFSGLTFEESYGLGWQRIVHPDDGISAMQRWQAALSAGEIFESEYRLRDRNGHYRWHIGRNVPLRDDGGQILGWFGTATDIQDLKDAQEELRQSHDSLEQRVEERTQSLQEQALALQEEVVERQRLEEQSKQLMQRIVQVQEEERGRISRELHDNLGQHATAILLSLQLLQDAENQPAQGERRQSAAQLMKLHGQMDELLSMTHRLAWELRPAILDNIGLEAALRQYVKEWGRGDISADFVSRLPDSDGAKAEIGLSPDAETALYRVVQEALTNVLRHAEASMVSVVLERRADYVTAIVEDNGRGFDVEAMGVSNRLGVRGMQERMDLVGGTLEVESQPAMGTTIYARVPLEAE